MTRRQDAWDYLGICDAGAYGQEGDAHITTYDKRLERYYCRLREGGVVIDKRPAMLQSEGECIREIVSGPMLDTTKPPDFEEGNRAFDYCGIQVAIQRWMLLGARVGVRRGDTIEWRDGQRESIAQFED